MPLPSLVVQGNLKEVLGDVANGQISESALRQAIVTFTPNVSPSQWVRWAGQLKRITSVSAVVNTVGDIVRPNGDPVTLLAQDDGLNIRGLQWQFRVELPTSAMPFSPAGRMVSWWFNATTNGTVVQLASVAPVVGTPIYGTTPGGQPTTISTADITDMTAIGRALARAASQSDARAAIGANVAGSTTLPNGPSALSGHRIVTVGDDGKLLYASCALGWHAQRPSFMTVAAANANASTDVISNGPVTEPSWAWTPGQPLFLGTAGALVQTVPDSAVFVRRLGDVITPTSVVFNPAPAIKIA